MREIQLTNNRGIALVDDEDYEKVAHFTWRLTESLTQYAVCSREFALVKKLVADLPYWSSLVRLHHVILGRYVFTDHRNGNGLDNQKHNLRPANSSLNNFNKTVKPNPSGYRGVIILKKSGIITARLKHQGICLYLGSFQTVEEAARAYDKKAYEIAGEFARLNFPLK